MTHIRYGDKSLFLGDAGADTLLEYAAVLANEGRADTVNMEGIGPDGNTVTMTFLLNSGSSLVAESTNTTWNETDITEPVRYMRERMAELTDPPNASSVRPSDEPGDSALEY